MSEQVQQHLFQALRLYLARFPSVVAVKYQELLIFVHVFVNFNATDFQLGLKLSQIKPINFSSRYLSSILLNFRVLGCVNLKKNYIKT